jgi:hypothetical protein
MRRATAISLVILLSWALVASRAAADAAAVGRISGVLKDPTGAVVSGAKVEIENLASGLRRSVTTNPAGRFAFDGLIPGRYQATIVVSGFEIVIVRDIAVAAGKETVVNVTLRIASQKTNMEVNSPDLASVAGLRTGQSAHRLRAQPSAHECWRR